MSRRAYNVLVLPFYEDKDGNFQYCIFQRSDVKIWQFIAGGGNDIEEPIETAVRETYEESGISDTEFIQLKTITYMPTYFFPEIHKRLSKFNIYVIPLYCFYTEVFDKKIILSDEHLQYKWVDYETAIRHFSYDVDKTSLWELASIIGDKKLKII